MRPWPRPSARARQIEAAGTSLLLGSVGGILLRCLLFLVAARLLGLLAAVLGAAIGLVPSADPVYTRTALQTFSDLSIRGIAVAGPPGDWLHAHLPAVFAGSEHAAWSPIRVVARPGSAVLARLIAASIAHVGVLFIGLLVVRRGLLARRPTLVVGGLAAQAQVAMGMIGAPPRLADLEASGLSFAINMLFPWLSGRRLVVSDLFAGVPRPLLVGILVALAVLVDLLAAGLGASLLLAARRRARAWLAGRVTDASGHRARRPAITAAPALLAASLVLASGAVAAASQLVEGASTSLPPLVVAPPPLPEGNAGLARPSTTAAVAAVPRVDAWWHDARVSASTERPGPSRVEVRGSGATFEYLVDGRPEIIRGMGLNTQYAKMMTPEERAARLDEDFTLMRAMGVNTVLGWDPGEFDAPLFATAQAHGIGVVPPFDLSPDADYTDPAVRERLTAEVLDWVGRYRDEPALRMWGLGNEVLHKIVHPSWLGPQDPSRERQARAFASWLVETADAIHQADPDHPVTYREAEDAFVPWVLAALRDAGGGPRPWFVFGTNCYSDHLADIVDTWPKAGGGLALWISEFAPGGMAPPDRAEGFREMWGYVRRNPGWVLGGAVYAWTRNGPEEIDRTMGLTDDGVPADGGSMEALGPLFAGGLTGETSAPTP